MGRLCTIILSTTEQPALAQITHNDLGYGRGLPDKESHHASSSSRSDRNRSHVRHHGNRCADGIEAIFVPNQPDTPDSPSSPGNSGTPGNPGIPGNPGTASNL